MINYTGLRKRPTFEGFVNYLANKQETIRYPDRFAKQIREHPYLTQLDGEGLLEMEELDRKRAEYEYKEKRVREIEKIDLIGESSIKSELEIEKKGKKKEQESTPSLTPDDNDFYKSKYNRVIVEDLIRIEGADQKRQRDLKKMNRTGLLEIYKPYVKQMTSEHRSTLGLPG